MLGNAAYGLIIIIDCRLNCTQFCVLNHFRARCGQKYTLYKKMLQIKVVQNSISYEKFSGRMSISYRSGARGLQRLP